MLFRCGTTPSTMPLHESNNHLSLNFPQTTTGSLFGSAFAGLEIDDRHSLNLTENIKEQQFNSGRLLRRQTAF